MNKRIPGNLLSILLLFFGLLISAGKSNAQQYPVQCNVQLIPPYSVHLADYYKGGNQKLLVNLTLKDLQRTDLSVRLRISIEGQGIKLTTKDDFVPKNPVLLLPGTPELLYGDRLEEYLAPEHLNFAGITKNQFLKTGRLPEGVYKFTVEVFEARRKEKVSNTATTMAWMILNEPPVITTPTNNKIVKASDPASIFFNWLPRHMNSQNALADVEYEFTLVEIWPVNQSAEEAIRSKEPLLKTIFRNTSFVYDAQYPMLMPGRKYACRVRAFSNEQKEMFKNEGYSPVVSFVFGQECKPPIAVDVDPFLGGSAQLSIIPQQNHSSFTIQIRDVEGSKWYAQQSVFPDFELKQLKPGATYEYKVQAQCESLESDFTAIKQFTLSKEQEVVECGQSADVPEIDNSPALNELQPGDIIKAGGFEVLVKKSSGRGSFTGSGVVRIGLLGNVELRTVFENIRVNESFQLTAGEIRVVGSDVYALGGDIRDGADDFFNDDIWDDIDDAIEDAEDIVDNISDLQDDLGDNNLNDELEDAKEIIERGRDLLALDDPKGADLIKEGADKVAQILDKVNSGDFQITANGIFFLAHDNQNYGFDSHEIGLTEEEKKAYLPYYESLQLGDTTKQYYLKAWKSIGSNGNDEVNVEMQLSNGMQIDTVHFMNAMGAEITPQKQGDVFSLNVRGSFHEDVQQITAYYNVKDDSTQKTKKVLLGALNVISYDQIEKNLVLVPVNGNSTSIPQAQLETYLNDTYSPANVRWTVSQHAGVQVEYSDDMSQGLDDGESKMLSNYTKEMNKVIKALKRSGDYDDNKTYLFLVDKAKNASKAGFMPKKRPWGFIFTDIHKRNNINPTNALCRTIAHEVAHGEFRLSHPFQDFPSVPENSTQNLMDYADGQQLRKYQWDDIHNLRDVKLWGQEEEGNASQLVSDPVCTQKLLEQFRWAYVHGEKLNYQADGYPWIGHHAKELILGDNQFEKISIEVREAIDFIPTKVNSQIHYGRADVLYGKVLVISSIDKFDLFQDYLYPDLSEYNHQIGELIIKINSIEDKFDLLNHLAILPYQEYDRMSPNDISHIFNKIADLFTMTTDYISCVNTEEIILKIIESCKSDNQKQMALLNVLRKGNNINRFIAHLDGENRKEFLFTCAKFEIQNTTPDVTEIYRQNFNYLGDIYTKVFNWEETLSPDIIFISENLVRTGEFKISTKNDWISILQDEKYLAQLKSFEYVAIMSENVQGYLPADFIPGESVAYIPAFLLHYILEEKHSEQIKDDIATLFDLGLTVSTLGSYAAGKKAIEIVSESAYAALIDFGIQSLTYTILDEIPFSQAVDSVDFNNVIWASGAIHINNTKYAYALGCLRNGVKGTLKPTNNGIKEALKKGVEYCLQDLFLTAIGNVAVKVDEGMYAILLRKIKINPVFVTKRLLKYGVNKTIIRSFKSNIYKEEVNQKIEKGIEEYEKEI
nr:fibronectin type III domain-containing protein [uncultured Marinifilum sp.]